MSSLFLTAFSSVLMSYRVSTMFKLFYGSELSWKTIFKCTILLL